MTRRPKISRSNFKTVRRYWFSLNPNFRDDVFRDALAFRALIDGEYSRRVYYYIRASRVKVLRSEFIILCTCIFVILYTFMPRCRVGLVNAHIPSLLPLLFLFNNYRKSRFKTPNRAYQSSLSVSRGFFFFVGDFNSV